jgi:ribulose-5-phosphate 4-epimerase/fuculose-1-phosphate aldolase
MSGLARQIRAAERPNTECTAEEWRVRCELAALYRLFDHYGMTDLIYTHISARVPGEPEHYLINPYGLLFNEITASNLIKVNYAGEVVAGDYPYNEAGHLIHSAVLKARPDINYALHSHTRAGIAVSAMKGGLQPLSQHALLVLGTLAYHKYGALFAEEEECASMAQDLGDKYLLVMENHGLLSVGRTAAEAFQYLYYLEMSCKVQVDILQSGQEPIIPPADAIADLGQRGAPGEEPWGAETWPALLRLLDRKDPSYKN